MAERYRDRVHFLAVYVREAHPEDGWILPENRRSGVAVTDPKTDDAQEIPWISDIFRILKRNPKIKNIYFELGSTFGSFPAATL